VRAHPAWQSAQPGNGSQRAKLALELECSQILADDFRHAHTQRCRKILDAHLHLTLGIVQQLQQRLGQALHIAWFKEINCQPFFFGQLTKISNVRGDDRYSVSASQVRHPAGTRR